MKRIKLPLVIDCGKEKKTVTIEYVYNHAYDEYNELIGSLARLKNVSKEIGELDFELKIDTDRGSELMFSKVEDKKVKREEIKNIIIKRAENNTQIKVLRKEAVKINENFIQKNLCQLAIKILKDNEIEDKDLQSVDFWHNKVLPGEAWSFIVSAINKDSSKKKQAETLNSIVNA